MQSEADDGHPGSPTEFVKNASSKTRCSNVHREPEIQQSNSSDISINQNKNTKDNDLEHSSKNKKSTNKNEKETSQKNSDPKSKGKNLKPVSFARDPYLHSVVKEVRLKKRSSPFGLKENLGSKLDSKPASISEKSSIPYSRDSYMTSVLKGSRTPKKTVVSSGKSSEPKSHNTLDHISGAIARDPKLHSEIKGSRVTKKPIQKGVSVTEKTVKVSGRDVPINSNIKGTRDKKKNISMGVKDTYSNKKSNLKVNSTENKNKSVEKYPSVKERVQQVQARIKKSNVKTATPHSEAESHRQENVRSTSRTVKRENYLVTDDFGGDHCHDHTSNLPNDGDNISSYDIEPDEYMDFSNESENYDYKEKEIFVDKVSFNKRDDTLITTLITEHTDDDCEDDNLLNEMSYVKSDKSTKATRSGKGRCAPQKQSKHKITKLQKQSEITDVSDKNYASSMKNRQDSESSDPEDCNEQISNKQKDSDEELTDKEIDNMSTGAESPRESVGNMSMSSLVETLSNISDLSDMAVFDSLTMFDPPEDNEKEAKEAEVTLKVITGTLKVMADTLGMTNGSPDETSETLKVMAETLKVLAGTLNGVSDGTINGPDVNPPSGIDCTALVESQKNLAAEMLSSIPDAVGMLASGTKSSSTQNEAEASSKPSSDTDHADISLEDLKELANIAMPPLDDCQSNFPDIASVLEDFAFATFDISSAIGGFPVAIATSSSDMIDIAWQTNYIPKVSEDSQTVKSEKPPKIKSSIRKIPAYLDASHYIRHESEEVNTVSEENESVKNSDNTLYASSDTLCNSNDTLEATSCIPNDGSDTEITSDSNAEHKTAIDTEHESTNDTKDKSTNDTEHKSAIDTEHKSTIDIKHKTTIDKDIPNEEVGSSATPLLPPEESSADASNSAGKPVAKAGEHPKRRRKSAGAQNPPSSGVKKAFSKIKLSFHYAPCPF